MKIETVSIPVNPDESVSGILAAPDTLNHNSSTALVFAHGMANDMNHPSIVGVAEGLAKLGFFTLRFNFPYREKGIWFWPQFSWERPKTDSGGRWQKS